MKRFISFALLACAAIPVCAQGGKTAFYVLEVNGRRSSICPKIDVSQTSGITIGGDLDRDGWPDYVGRHTPFHNRYVVQNQLLYDPVMCALVSNALRSVKFDRATVQAWAVDSEFRSHKTGFTTDGWQMLSVSFPRCNANTADGSTNQWPLLAFASSSSTPVPATGEDFSDVAKHQKKWLTSNFDCDLVDKKSGQRIPLRCITVDPPTASRTHRDDDCDGTADDVWETTDMVLTCPQSEFEKLAKWEPHKAPGLDAPEIEITYFDRNADGTKTVIATLSMQGVKKAQYSQRDSNGNVMAVVTVKVGRIEFKV